MIGKIIEGTILANLVETFKSDVELKFSPIEPSWVIEGDPIARNALLSQSPDGASSTIIWQCTEGKFDWHYDIDETIYILEGEVVLQSAEMSPTRFGPGDIVFFKRGARVRWHVARHVRKLAFCRRPQPALLLLWIKVKSKLKRWLMPSGGSSVGFLGAN